MSADYWIRKLQLPASILFWVWLAFLLVMSVLPGLPKNEFRGSSPFRPDYLFHFGVHFILAGLFLWWKYSILFYRNRPALTFSLFLLLAVAVFTEMVQKYIPSRTFNKWDMFYNVLGVLLGWALVYLFLNMFLKHSGVDK